MRRVEYWCWRVNAETAPFRPYNTRHRMTEEVALARHPEAVRVPGTLEIRDIPETDEERMANTTSAWQKAKR